MSGRFIVLEGIDGAGTTTQLHRLAAWLRGRGERVYVTYEPSDGPIGRHIRRILRGELPAPPHDAIALLFAADRLQHLEDEVLPRQAEGAHVLCDRYVGSSFAYQGAHSDPAWVRVLNSHARAPDLTIYVRVDPDTALARIGTRDGERRELFERRETLARIAAAYDAIYGAAGPAELPAVIVDGAAPPDDVFAACRAAVEASFADDVQPGG